MVLVGVYKYLSGGRYDWLGRPPNPFVPLGRPGESPIVYTIIVMVIGRPACIDRNTRSYFFPFFPYENKQEKKKLKKKNKERKKTRRSQNEN